MADTYDVTIGDGGAGVNAHSARGPYKVKKVLDFENDSALTALNAGAGPGQNDVLQLIHVPANSIVLGVFYETVTASTALNNLDIGDGDDVDGYHDGIDATSTGDGYNGLGKAPTLVEGTPNTLTGFALGKFYTAADTIDAKIITAASITDGVIEVTAVILTLDA